MFLDLMPQMINYILEINNKANQLVKPTSKWTHSFKLTSLNELKIVTVNFHIFYPM